MKLVKDNCFSSQLDLRTKNNKIKSQLINKSILITKVQKVMILKTVIFIFSHLMSKLFSLEFYTPFTIHHCKDSNCVLRCLQICNKMINPCHKLLSQQEIILAHFFFLLLFLVAQQQRRNPPFEDLPSCLIINLFDNGRTLTPKN